MNGEYAIIIYMRKTSTGFLLCLSVFALVGCGSKTEVPQSDQSEHILTEQVVSGVEVARHNYPFLASFAGCTASIIDAQWALTANRCPDVGYNVVAGEHNRNEKEGNEQIRKVVKTIRHKDWHDVKLLKLESPLIFNQYVQPIQVGDLPVLSQRYLVAGWGKTTLDATGEKSDTPNVYLGSVTDPSVCGSGQGEFCMQGYIPIEKSQPCYGDSGGPAFRMIAGKYVMVGSVQGRAANAKTECGDGFATFATIDKEWVKKTISEN